MLSDRPVGAGDVCSGPEIPDQPDEVTVVMLVEEIRPYIWDVLLSWHVANANLAFLHDLVDVEKPQSHMLSTRAGNAVPGQMKS